MDFTTVQDADVPVPGANQDLRKVENEPGREVAMLFIGVSLALGIVSRQLLKGSRFPYTVGLLLLGLGLGGLEHGTQGGLGTLGKSIRMWSNVDPNLILFIFLPALLFESSFALEIHQIKRCMLQMVLLAGPGVVITTFSLGLVHKYLFPYGWNWSTSLLLGGLLGATDPVAVVALLKELGVGKKLSTIIEGEALMNDGVAIVVYRLFLRMTLGQSFNATEIILFLCRVSLGAVALGLAFGLVSVVWLGTVFNDTVIEIILTFTASYMAFFVAEDGAEVSGVLTVMTIGIFFAAFARTSFTGESAQTMHHFWEMIAYIANTLIFILSGVLIAESILRSRNNIDGHDWGYLLMLYAFVQLSRALVVLVLYPGLRMSGYGLDWKEALVLVWSGLRGAVALSLALLVAQVGVKDPAEYLYISQKTEAQFVFFTGGVVFLTLIINGSTTQFLVHFLGIARPSKITDLMLDYVKFEMYSKAVEAYGDLGEDEELGPADWGAVKEYVSCLRQVSEGVKPLHPHLSTDSGVDLRDRHMQDTRLRFLNGVQAAYWKMLEEGRISQAAAIILMQSVNEALDDVSHHYHTTMNEWKALQPNVHFPQFFKNMQWRSSNWVPQKLLSYFLAERLELGCYLSAAFLRAHRQVRHHLREFIGESEVADAIILESEAEGEKAKQFLEDIRLSFPQVLRGIKTRQVTHAVLLHLTDYVESLKTAGLLREKEILHLHDSVQVDLKRLMRNPPLIQMPSATELLRTQPLIGALPPRLQEPLVSAAKEYMKQRGTPLYNVDSTADGIWLIANGTLQWSSKALESRRLLNSTFCHGTVMGLYEVLTGKPHLCSIIADSAVHCFYIERSNIMAALQYEPDMEDFFWLESALVVAKIVMPQWLEGVSMQELRSAVAGGSAMEIYLTGEEVEIRHGRICILLEGFVKGEGNEELISAPAGLVSETYTAATGSGHQGTFFKAEARIRVLFLEHSVLSSNASRISPFQSRKALIPRLLSHEQLIHSRRSHQNGETASNKVSAPQAPEENSSRYMAKACQLGLFGSEASMVSRSGKEGNLSRLLQVNVASRSYPNFLTRVAPVHRPNSAPFQGNSHKRVVSREMRRLGDSSDDSDGDEEIIVEIGSPSTFEVEMRN